MRTGRSILKRQGLGGASESVRLENGRKVENGRKMLVLWGAETQKIEFAEKLDQKYVFGRK